MNVIRHCTEIVHGGWRSEHTWVPTCTCGWEGQEVDRRLDAVEDADEHVRSLP